MALLVSGSSTIPGVITVSNDEGWAFQCYVSGSLMSIEGVDNTVNVWMSITGTTSVANIQWIPGIPVVWLDGGNGGPSPVGYVYPRGTGIRPDEITIEYEEVFALSAFDHHNNYIGYVGGYLFYGSSGFINRVGLLSTATDNKSVAITSIMARMLVYDVNTVYGEMFVVNPGTDEYDFVKVDFLTETVTILDTRLVEIGPSGVDCDGLPNYFYEQGDGWVYLAKWNGKEYYMAAGEVDDNCGAMIGLYVYDLVNNTVVKDVERLQFNSYYPTVCSQVAGVNQITIPRQWQNKVVWSMCSYNSSICSGGAGVLELPYPTFVYDLDTDVIDRISPGIQNGFGDFFDMYGSGMDIATGKYFLAIYDEEDRYPGGGHNILYTLDIAGGSPSYVQEWYRPRRNTNTVYQAQNTCYIIFMNLDTDLGNVYKAPDLTNVGSIPANEYWNWMEIVFDQTNKVRWYMDWNYSFQGADVAMNSSIVDGDTIHGVAIEDGVDKTINLNHTTTKWQYTYDRYVLLFMLAGNVAIAWFGSDQLDDNVSPFSTGLTQRQLKAFRRVGS